MFGHFGTLTEQRVPSTAIGSSAKMIGVAEFDVAQQIPWQGARVRGTGCRS